MGGSGHRAFRIADDDRDDSRVLRNSADARGEVSGSSAHSITQVGLVAQHSQRSLSSTHTCRCQARVEDERARGVHEMVDDRARCQHSAALAAERFRQGDRAHHIGLAGHACGRGCPPTTIADDTQGVRFIDDK